MLPRRLIFVVFIPLVLITVGTVGYMLIAGWDWFDALYMTVLTVTTVGFFEVRELDSSGRAFTMFLMLGGVFTIFYCAGELIRLIVSGEIQVAIGKELMERNLSELNDHVIVCGYGRMGRLVCKEFTAQKLSFVAIEKNADALEGFSVPRAVCVHGDATSDDVLRRVGIERARALVSLVASDADNLYITMSARLLNEKLFIVARAEEDRSSQKLIRAGASRVVSPYLIGGAQVAHAVLRPAVLDFIELATRTEHLELQIEETQLGPKSSLVAKSLRDSQLRQKHGVIVVAIKKSAGSMVYNPLGDTIMEQGDTLIALGHRDQLDELERMAKG